MKSAPLPMPGETFRQHPTHGHLLVSDQGRVFSFKSRRLIGSRHNPGHARGYPLHGEYLKTSANGRTVYVHSLVLETFVGPRPAEHDADHIDHDGLNNRLSNLRWRPIAENRADTAVRFMPGARAA